MLSIYCQVELRRTGGSRTIVFRLFNYKNLSGYTMPKGSQWSVRELLLWVLVAALIGLHIASFFRAQESGNIEFSLNGYDIERWFKEIDPTAKVHEGGGRSEPSKDSFELFNQFVFTSKKATSTDLLDYLEASVKKRMGDKNWTVPRSLSFGTHSYVIQGNKPRVQLRILISLHPNSSNLSKAAREQEELGHNVTTISVFQVGYRKP